MEEDKLERFEKVLNLVEKVRSLDLLTANIVKQINQQQIDLYKEVSTECFGDFGNMGIAERNERNERNEKKNEKKNERNEKKNERNEKKNETEKKNEKETEKKVKDDMDSKISIENLAEFLKKAATDMKNIKENPPESPIPPDAPTHTNEDHLDAQLNKLRKMSVIVSEHLRIQADMHKYAAQAIAETHKLSFELYKDIEKCLSSAKG